MIKIPSETRRYSTAEREKERREKYFLLLFLPPHSFLSSLCHRFSLPNLVLNFLRTSLRFLNSLNSFVSFPSSFTLYPHFFFEPSLLSLLDSLPFPLYPYLLLFCLYASFPSLSPACPFLLPSLFSPLFPPSLDSRVNNKYAKSDCRTISVSVLSGDQ